MSEISGKNKRSRRADLCVSRDQVVLGLANIGPPFEQRRRKSGGQVGRRGDLFQGLAARNIARRIREEQV